MITSPSGNIIGMFEGDAIVPDLAPNRIIPVGELPVYGNRPPDRKWSIDRIIGELDNGQFQSAGLLGDSIKRDARIMGALEQRNAGLFGAPLELTPSRFGLGQGDEDSHQAVDIRDEIQAGWESMFPRAELEELHQYGILQGVAIAQKIWDVSMRPWTFKIDVFHPQYYMWLWNTQSYYLTVFPNPADRDSRAFLRVPQQSTQFINHTPYGYKRGYLNGRLRALVDPWMMRQWDKNDWAHWCEIHGHPIRKAIVPQLADPKQERDFVREVANLGSNTTVKTRQDSDGNKYDIELVEAMSMGWKGFEAMLAWCDREISNVLLGQSQSTDGQGGLGATENPGDSVRNDIKLSDSFKLCETLYTQALREYCLYNYGNADLAPRPKYQVEPPEDESQVATRDQAIGATLVAFKTAGAPVNVRAFLEERGIPLLTPEEEVAQKSQALEEAQAMMAATAPAEPEEDPADKEANRLRTVSEAMKNFRMAGAPIDDIKVMTAHKVPHVDSED